MRKRLLGKVLAVEIPILKPNGFLGGMMWKYK